MSTDEIRFIGETVRLLGVQVRELSVHVASLKITRGAFTSEAGITLLNQIEEELLDLDARFLRLLESFPKEETTPGERTPEAAR